MQNSHITAIVRKKPTVCIYVCYIRAERKLQNTSTAGSQKVKWVLCKPEEETYFSTHTSFVSFKTCVHRGAEEMAQWLRELDALPEDLGPIPLTHMAAHNNL